MAELERARRYAEALRSFLCGCAGWSIDDSSRPLLAQVDGALEAARRCIAETLAANPVVEEPVPPPIPDPAPTADAKPARPATAESSAQPVATAGSVVTSAVGGAPPARPRSAGAALVLKDTEMEPCLQEFQGRRELTPEAIAKVDSFAADQALEMTEHERRRFLQSVQRWIESTPDGQVLAIRVSELHGAPKPYPQYRPDPNHKSAPGG